MSVCLVATASNLKATAVTVTVTAKPVLGYLLVRVAVEISSRPIGLDYGKLFIYKLR